MEYYFVHFLDLLHLLFSERYQVMKVIVIAPIKYYHIILTLFEKFISINKYFFLCNTFENWKSKNERYNTVNQKEK